VFGNKILEVEEIVKEMVSSEPTKTLISGIVDKYIDHGIDFDHRKNVNVILFKKLTVEVLGLHAHEHADSGVSRK
jgi:hypothetical protein